MQITGFSTGKLSIIKRIGRGGQAHIYLAKPNIGPLKNKEVVLKIFNHVKDFKNEVKIINYLNSKSRSILMNNIPDIIDKGVEKSFRNESINTIIMPYYNGGDAVDFSHEIYGNSIYDNCIKTEIRLKEIWKTLSFIHENDIMHLDIKPENILFNNNYIGYAKCSITPKLIDWGLSINGSDMYHRRRGTMKYIAPEIWEKSYCSKKSDVWSMGITWACIITCQPHIFEYAGSRHIKQKGWKYLRDEKSDIWWDLSDLTRKIIEASLVPDFNDRATSQEIVELFYKLYIYIIYVYKELL